MSDYTKFMFDLHDFDEEAMARKKAEEEAPPPPSFSEEELEQAKAEAFQKGRVQGIDEERQKLHQQALNTVMQLKPELQTLLQNERGRNQRFVDDTIALILESLTQAFPDFFEESFLQIMHDFVRDHVQAHAKTPLISIFVHPDVKDAVAEHVSALQQELHHDGRVDVRSDPNTPVGACRITWPNGGATWSPHSLHEEIIDTYRRYLDPDYVRVAQPPIDHDALTEETNHAETAEGQEEPEEVETVEAQENLSTEAETPLEEEINAAETDVDDPAASPENEQEPEIEKQEEERLTEALQPEETILGKAEPAEQKEEQPSETATAEHVEPSPPQNDFTQSLSELEGDPVNPGQGQKPKDVLDDIDLHAHLDKDVAPQGEHAEPLTPPTHESTIDSKKEE